jgi:hypothetical protein
MDKNPSPKSYLQTKRIIHEEFQTTRKLMKKEFQKSNWKPKREAFISICPSTRVTLKM